MKSIYRRHVHDVLDIPYLNEWIESRKETQR
jgi:hypothetical protein